MEFVPLSTGRAAWPEDIAALCEWLLDFVASPHPECGRADAVCPALPDALQQSKLGVAAPQLLPQENKRKHIADLIEKCAVLLEPTRNPFEWPLSCLVLPFQGLAPSEYRYCLEGAYLDVKAKLVEAGILVGAFHPYSNRPSRLNPAFFPLRSPLPFIALRHLLRQDIRTLKERSDYVAAHARFFSAQPVRC
ncbi:MAG TPA: hypothetical protein VMG08_16170 [Allosphingosinicella sp.]|nr:hypothetical protein [Allosphingosinicella sp.]